jgi:AcrR family transcriptional regulator
LAIASSDVAKGTTSELTERPARSGRAAPLAPAERRAAIIDATIPLLREHGPALTTRRSAEAAQVAEGTIFSVFPDKETLIAAAVDAAVDPTDTVARVEAIDATLPLAARAECAVAAIQQHFGNIWRLLAAIGPAGPTRRAPEGDQAFTVFGDALVAVLAPDADTLRMPPEAGARALLGMTLGCSHPVVAAEPMTPEEIVQLFIHGAGVGQQ